MSVSVAIVKRVGLGVTGGFPLGGGRGPGQACGRRLEEQAFHLALSVHEDLGVECGAFELASDNRGVQALLLHHL